MENMSDEPAGLSESFCSSEASFSESNSEMSSAKDSTIEKGYQKYFESDGEIGYRKGAIFVALTNFSIKCVGYVKSNPNAKSADGFLLEVIPKESVVTEGSEQGIEERDAYYLTWRDMSTQNGILNVINSAKLWTTPPAKEQYLPKYLKELCDEYQCQENARMVFPVQLSGLGLQKPSIPPTWVLGSNFQVTLESGVAMRLNKDESPYHSLGGSDIVLTYFDTEDNLDQGASLRRMVEIQKKYVGVNFPSNLLLLGGLGLAVRYEQLSTMYDGVPLIMAYGHPVSGKSSAVKAVMAVIGQDENKTGDCSHVGAMATLSRQSLPFWWDDVADMSVLEKVTVDAFNKSKRKKKGGKDSFATPRTVPICTMNPSTIGRVLANDKERMLRIFSRSAVIPYKKLQTKEGSLKKSLALQAAMKEVMAQVIRSVGVILQLRDDFSGRQEDELFNEVVHFTEELTIDLQPRDQTNYALLLYSTIKIIEKIGMKNELWPVLKSHFADVVIPHHRTFTLQNIQQEENATSDVQFNGNGNKDSMIEVIEEVLTKVTEDPQSGKKFLNPKYLSRNCDCGEVLGFHVAKALESIEKKTLADELKRFVRRTNIGCTGRKIRCYDIQLSGVHIKRKVLNKDVVAALDEVKGAFNFAEKIRKPITPRENDKEESLVPNTTGALKQKAANVNDVVEEVKEKTAAENCKMPPQKEGTSSEEIQVVQQGGKGAKRKTTNSEQKANGGLSDKLTSYFEPANPDKRTRRQKKWFDEQRVTK